MPRAFSPWSLFPRFLLKMIIGIVFLSCTVHLVTCGLSSHLSNPSAFLSYSLDHSLVKRAVLSNSNASDAKRNPSAEYLDPLKVSSFDTQDQNDQMLLYIAGDGNPLMFGFTRRLNYSENFTSSFFASYDHGVTFKNLTEKLLAPGDQKSLRLHSAIRIPQSANHHVLTDVHNRVIITTSDGCKSFTRINVSFVPSEVVMDPRNPLVILSRDDKDPKKQLWISRDFGRRWEAVEQYVSTVVFGNQPYDFIDGRSAVYILRAKPNGRKDVFRTDTYFQTGKSLLMADVEEFELHEDFLFATKSSNAVSSLKAKLNSNATGLDLWISYKRMPFLPAEFGTKEKLVDFFISNATSSQAVIAATLSNGTTDLYFSEPGTFTQSGSGVERSRKNYFAFRKVLDNVLFYHPNENIGKFGDFKQYFWFAKPMADVLRVRGLDGVYIVNQLTPSHDLLHFMGNSISKISFDNGASWRPIKPPRFDYEGHQVPSKCEPDDTECSVHLLQTFPAYARTFNKKIFSSENVPGLIIASGTIGTSQMGGANHSIFISTNGGISWRESLRGMYKMAVGDYGGILVALNEMGRTNELLYSLNEGLSWHPFRFAESRMYVLDVLTESGEDSTVFIIFGTLVEDDNGKIVNSAHKWHVVRVNLTHVYNGSVCKDEDFKDWSFEDVRSGYSCWLGHKTRYQRRIATKKCTIGRQFKRTVKLDHCSCDESDFQCVFTHRRNQSASGLECVPVASPMLDDMLRPPADCPLGQFWNRTRGYEKIPGDTCEDGVEKRFEPERVPCPWPDGDEFLLAESGGDVKRISLGKASVQITNLSDAFDHGHESVFAMDFDYAKKCLFYSVLNPPRILRQCFDGVSGRTLLVSNNMSSPSILSFDWISRVLYWLDNVKGTIEAIQVDKPVEGHRRRTIISGVDLLFNVTAFEVFPPLGQMFWSRDGMYRANLDGSNIVQWRQGPSAYSIGFDQLRKTIVYPDSMFFDVREMSYENHSAAQPPRIIVSDNVKKPIVAAVHKNWIYYVGLFRSEIMMLNRVNGMPKPQKLIDLGEPIRYLKAFSPSQLTGSNPCAGNQTVCPKMCVSMPNLPRLPGYFCLCPDGFEGDGKTCKCPAGLEAGADGLCKEKVENSTGICTEGQFFCGIMNGKYPNCIPGMWRCDGDNDCFNGRDEEDCELEPKIPCLPGTFACADGSGCFPEQWRCDHERECRDGSDEMNCTYTTCKTMSEFMCKDGSGWCVPTSFICDGQDDCKDGSDELNCTYGVEEASVCGADEFKCVSDSDCIPKNWTCDGKFECADGSDEWNCTRNETTSCEPHQFFCKTTHKCITQTWVCDGMIDCSIGNVEDKSDEEGCGSPGPAPIPVSFNCPNSSGHSYLSCGDGLCVPWSWKCDGAKDCASGIDEEGCSVDDLDDVQCANGTLLCISTGKCIPDILKCDGVEHCPGGEDEQNCVCAKDEFDCGLPTSSVCIPDSFICDDDLDCPNGADEAAELCANAPKCRPDQYKCRMSGGCIPEHAVCDGKQDCPDSSDEFGCGGERQGCKLYEFKCTTGDKCVPLSARCDKKLDCPDGSDEAACGSVDPTTIRGFFVDRSSVTAKSARIWWTVAAADRVPAGSAWKVIVSTKGRQPVTYTVTGMNYTITDLEPYRDYKAVLKHAVIGVDRDWSVTFRTKMDNPSPPRNVKMTVSKSQWSGHPTLTISWDAPERPNGPIQRYVVDVKKSDGSRSSMSLQGSSFPLPEPPMEGVTYSATVTAFCGLKDDATLLRSPPSETANLTVHNEVIMEPIRNLKVEKVTDSSASLVWEKPVNALNLDGYNVSYQGMDRMETIATNGPRVDIKNLAAGKEYLFVIHPYNEYGLGPAAQIDVKTNGTGVAAPQVITVKNAAPTSVDLSWESPVTGDEGKNLVYGIYYGLGFEDLTTHGARMNVTGVTSHSVKELVSCRSYLFTVRVIGPKTYSELGEVIVGRTGSDGNSPPINMKVVKSDDKQFVDISGEVPCYEKNHKYSYTVRRTDLSNGEITTYFITASNGSLWSERMGVWPGHRYKLEAKAAGGAVWSSPPLEVYVPLYEEPKSFHVTPFSDHFRLSWTVPKSISKLMKDRKWYFNVSVTKDGVHLPPIQAWNTPVNVTREPGAVYAFRVAVADKEHTLSEWTPLLDKPADNGQDHPLPDQDAGSNAILAISILVVLAGMGTGGFFLFRRWQNAKRSQSSFTTTRFHNTPYGNEFMEIEDEDIPVFRAFADDEPLVNE